MVRPVAVSSPESGGSRLEPVRLAVRAQAGGGSRADALTSGTRRLGDFEIELERLDHGDAATIGVTLRNVCSEVLRVDSVVLGLRWCGHGHRSLRFLRHGWQSWSFTGVRPLDSAGEPEFPSGPWLRGMHHCLPERDRDRLGWHESDILSLLAGPGSGPACLVGVLETGRAFGVVHLLREQSRSDAECAVLVDVELRLEIPLEPGESRRVEAVRLALGDDPNRLLERFAELWGRRAGALRQSAFQMGWCSWYHFFHAVSEQDLLRNLDALAADRDGLPVELVQLDDGYQRALGDWLETNEKFPSGLAAVAEAIRSAGFEAGIWTAPFAASAESDVLRAHPDWPLRDGEAWLRGTHNPAWSRDGWCTVLDPSREPVQRHLEHLFRGLVEMGFGYLKLDFLYMAAMRASARDPGLSRAARLRRGLEAIRSGAGDETFLLGCGAPLGPAVGLVDGMRIGPDVAPHWHADRSTAIPGLEATTPSTRSALGAIAARAWMHRRLWLNDPDCLMARGRDTGLAADEAGALATAIAVTGGMLVFSDDVAALSSAERGRVRETAALARQVDGVSPRGVARLADPLDGDPLRLLLAGQGRDVLLAAINMGEREAVRELDLDGLGLLAQPHAIEELLADADAPGPSSAHTGSRSDAVLPLRLRPHESALYRVRGAREIAVFCDFDGTFSVQDVGSTLARRHLSERRTALWQRLEREELDAWQYAVELFDGLQLSRGELDRFLETIELDPGAASLLAWCRERSVGLRILSDGFGHNLDRLRAMHGLHFEYSANRLRFEGDIWRVAAGHRNPACTCGCGSCKRGLIEAHRLRHPGNFCVHVGNGRVSDLCGALAADLVFAKDTLAPALQERGVFYHPFETLHDVVEELSRLS